jgi:hypothetical protein
MLERDLQRYFIAQVKERKLGIAVKVDCPSRRGWPDLNYVDCGGTIRLIEMKTPTGRLSLHQKELHETLRMVCICIVTVLASKDEIDTYLNEIHYAYFA